MRSSHRRIAIALVAVASLAIVAFAPVVGFGFVYDDSWTVVENKALDRPLRQLLGILAAGRGVVAEIPDATRPMMVASIWLDRRLWGLSPAGYHAHSLALYAAVCALAGLSAFALTRRRRAAVIAAAVFTLAPVHAEVVAAVNYREDLLSAIGLLGALTWVFWPGRRPFRPTQQAALALLWTFGLLGKESAVALVPLLILLPFVRGAGRAFWARSEAGLYALGAAFIVWINWRVALVLTGDDVPRAARGALDDQLLDTARFLVDATFHALVPLGWSPEHEQHEQAGLAWVAALAILVGAVVALAQRRSLRPFATGITIAMAASLPACPLVGPVNAWTDRYLFVPVLGGAIVWGSLAELALLRYGRRLPSVVFAVALVGLFVECRRATAPWRDELSLWMTATERAPGSPRSWTGRSRAERLKGDVDAAGQSIRRALELDPRYVPARVTKIYTLLARGDTGAARFEIDRLRAAGAGEARGLVRAGECAALEPDRAKRCIER